MLDLILKDIDDQHIRENFFRIARFLNDQVFFDGDFQLYDITIPAASDNFKIRHGLNFIPVDIIPLAIEGNYNFYFRYNDFDRDNMYLFAGGPMRIRFLAGKLKEKIKNRFSDNQTPPPFVPPGGVVPGGPGFVYGAVNSKTAGFWLTSEGIPSNIVGIPVLFGNASIIQAAVGTEVEADYTIGIYQHEGNGVNLQLLGTFAVTNGGPKRFVMSFPITYSSPNVQVATRIELGTTINLKVSLIINGDSI